MHGEHQNSGLTKIIDYKIVDPVDYSSSKITLIQYGTMVANLWFEEHNKCFYSYAKHSARVAQLSQGATQFAHRRREYRMVRAVKYIPSNGLVHG